MASPQTTSQLPLMLHAQGAAQEAARVVAPGDDEDVEGSQELSRFLKTYSRGGLMRPVTLAKRSATKEESSQQEAEAAVVVGGTECVSQLLPFWLKARKEGEQSGVSTGSAELDFNFPTDNLTGSHHVRLLLGFMAREKGTYRKTFALADRQGLEDHIKQLPGVKEEKFLLLDGHLTHSTNKGNSYLRLRVQGPESLPRVSRCFATEVHSRYAAPFIRTWSNTDGEVFGSNRPFESECTDLEGKQCAADLAKLYKRLTLMGDGGEVSQEASERHRRFAQVELKSLNRYVVSIPESTETLAFSFEDSKSVHRFEPTTNLRELVRGNVSGQGRKSSAMVSFSFADREESRELPPASAANLKDGDAPSDRSAESQFEKVFDILNYSGYALPSSALLPDEHSKKQNVQGAKPRLGAQQEKQIGSRSHKDQRESSRAATGARRNTLNKTLEQISSRSNGADEMKQSDQIGTVTLQAANLVWEDLRKAIMPGHSLVKKNVRDSGRAYPVFAGNTAPKFGEQGGSSDYFTPKQCDDLTKVFESGLRGPTELSPRILLGPGSFRDSKDLSSVQFRPSCHHNQRYTLLDRQSKSSVLKANKQETIFIQFDVNGKTLKMSAKTATWLDGDTEERKAAATILRPNCHADMQLALFTRERHLEDAFPNERDRDHLTSIGRECVQRVSKVCAGRVDHLSSHGRVDMMVLNAHCPGGNRGRDSNGKLFAFGDSGRFKWHQEFSYAFEESNWRYVNIVRGLSEVTQELQYIPPVATEPTPQPQVSHQDQILQRCQGSSQDGSSSSEGAVSVTPLLEHLQEALEFLDKADPPMPSAVFCSGVGKGLPRSPDDKKLPVKKRDDQAMDQDIGALSLDIDGSQKMAIAEPTTSAPLETPEEVETPVQVKPPTPATASPSVSTIVVEKQLEHGSPCPHFNLARFLKLHIPNATTEKLASTMSRLKEYYHVEKVVDLYALASSPVGREREDGVPAMPTSLRADPALAYLFQAPPCLPLESNEVEKAKATGQAAGETSVHAPQDTPLFYHRTQTMELAGLTGVVVSAGEIQVPWNSSSNAADESLPWANTKPTVLFYYYKNLEFVASVKELLKDTGVEIYVDSQRAMLAVENVWSKQRGVGFARSDVARDAGFWNSAMPPSHLYLSSGEPLRIHNSVTMKGHPLFTLPDEPPKDQFRSPLFSKGMLAGFVGQSKTVTMIQGFKFVKLAAQEAVTGKARFKGR